MCKRKDPEAKIFEPFGVFKWVKIQVVDYFLKHLLRIQSSIALYARCSYCKRCVQYAILGPKLSKNSSRWSLSQKFSLFSISIASHANCKHFQRCGEYGPQRLILGPFLVPNRGLRGPILGPLWAKFRSLVIFSKDVCIGFALNVFLRCVEYRPQRPNFRAPK